MNLAVAQQAVRDRGFDYLTPTQLTLMLNTGKDEFEDLYEWPWLQAFATAVTPAVLADFKLMQLVKVAGSNDELFGLDVRQVGLGLSDLTQAGTPDYWWIEGANKLHAWPGDGATLSVVYLRDSPPLAADVDTPLIPARYHSLWVDFAVCEAYKDSDNYAAAQALRTDTLTRMQAVITRYETRNRQHSPFITSRQLNEDD